MNKLVLVCVIILTIIIVGCSGVDVSGFSNDDLNRISGAMVVCNEPYMRFGAGCCLDKDSNSVCDADENNEKKEVEKVVENKQIDVQPNKVKIIEYGDFECPFCAKFYAETLPLIKKYYVDKGVVEFEFHHFPLSFHPNAQISAEASECAREQGKFWEMHDLLFEKGVSGGVAAFKSYAQQLGLDTAAFNECLDTGAMAAEVQKDMADGAAAGITGTPGFLVNGKLVSGAQPFSVFQQIIEAELN